jgi:malate dehydrogenase (oxaloacetate-decarboxylating)
VYAQPAERARDFPRTFHGEIGLADVIGRIDAGILIGLSTVGGAFTEPIVREMARKVERPIIFPLSNPTTRSEAVPADLIRWTDGRALVATGSPFAPVKADGRLIPIAQCNNVFIFPAMGLAVVASKARRVTDGMMLAAARTLGEHAPAMKDPSGSLLPALRDVRAVARAIATAAGLEAQRAGVAPKTSPEELRDWVAASQWTPEYSSFARVA